MSTYEDGDWSCSELVATTDMPLEACTLSQWQDVRDVGGIAQGKHTLLKSSQSGNEWIVTDHVVEAVDYEPAGWQL